MLITVGDILRTIVVFSVCPGKINYIITLGNFHARIWQVFFTKGIKNQTLLQQMATAAD
jgi:hypothetical protein